jgi:hypothetical protein
MYRYTHTHTHIGGDASRDRNTHVHARGSGLFYDTANVSCRRTNFQKSVYIHFTLSKKYLSNMTNLSNISQIFFFTSADLTCTSAVTIAKKKNRLPL